MNEEDTIDLHDESLDADESAIEKAEAESFASESLPVPVEDEPIINEQ